MRKTRYAAAMFVLAGMLTWPGCSSPEKRKAADERRERDQLQQQQDAKLKSQPADERHELEELQRQLDAKFKGKPAPDFELTAMDGKKVKLSDQKGKPVLLAFFSFG